VEREPWDLVRHAFFNHISLLRVLFSVVQPSSRFELRLYGERLARRDLLIGTHEMIPVESQTGSSIIRILVQFANRRLGEDVPFVLTNGDKKTGQVTEPITLYLTFVVSTNTTSSPVLPIDTTNLQSTEVNVSTRRNATSTMAQDFINNTRSTAAGPETSSPATDRLPGVPTPPEADPRVEISSAENALQVANEAMATISLSDTWEVSLSRIKWVMDTVSPVAEVRYDVLFANAWLSRMSSTRPQLSPYAKMAYGLLFAIPKVSRTRLRYRRVKHSFHLFERVDPPRAV
jgi:hypothetical protein